MSKVGFFRKFSENFESTTKKGDRGYLLDPEPFDMSQEGHFKARSAARKGKLGKG